MKAVIFILVLAASSLAHAQPVNDADLCRNAADRDVAIKHCTAAIETRKASNDILAQWHVLRGIRWGEKADYDRAIADHGAALKLDPNVRLANYYRGKAYSHKGEFDLAIADFDAAARLRVDDPVVYHARGVELAVKGDYARAIADFDRALQLDPKADGAYFARGRTRFYASDFARAAADLETAFSARPNIYTALWLYLARVRGGDNDADVLLERDTRQLRGGWPSVVVALYMGRTDIESVHIGAKAGDTAQQREMRCEADFYVAQSLIIKGERARAQNMLQAVQRACPKNLLEYEAAIAELRRLK